MAYSDSPRRQIPHAFAYGGRSPSTSPRKQYPSVDTTPTSPSSPTSPSYPRSSFDHEDPSSPLTPLWAMSSFVTSSSFSRSPTSVTLNEIGPPRLGSFDWSRSGPAESIEFSLKEFDRPPCFPSYPDQLSPIPGSPSTTFAAEQLPLATRHHRREHASTDLDKPSLHTTGILKAFDSRTRKSSKASQSLDMTPGSASSTNVHRRSKSLTRKRTHGHSNSTSSEQFPRRPSISASTCSTGTVTTTEDELASMSDAAEMVVRRRTRSHFDSLQVSLLASSLLPSTVIDSHRRSTSLGGERLDFAAQSSTTAPSDRLHLAHQQSPKASPAWSAIDPPLQPVPLRAQAPKRPALRSPPPPPMVAATPPPPLPLPARRPPPTRAPPPVPPLSIPRLFTSGLSRPPLTRATTTATAAAPETIEDMRKEAISAIREAECWDWPVPPPMARRHLLSPTRLTTVSSPVHEIRASTPRIGSIDFGVTSFDNLALASEPSRLLGFPWESHAGIESRRSSGSDEMPRTNSSTLSSELGPLTPDDVHYDPFDRLTASSSSAGHHHKQLPPLPSSTASSTSSLSPRYRASTMTMSSSRFGVPF